MGVVHGWGHGLVPMGGVCMCLVGAGYGKATQIEGVVLAGQGSQYVLRGW